MDLPNFNLQAKSWGAVGDSIAEAASNESERQRLTDEATDRSASLLEVTVEKLDRSVQLQLDTLRATEDAASIARAAAEESERSARRATLHSLITGYASAGLGLASFVTAVIALVVANQ